jgi:phosphoribosylamine--glycine ligase
MGACSPAAVVTPPVEQRILREIIEPAVRGMGKDGAAFTGFLYAGVRVDASGAPRVVEFKVRLGDPEAQPVMMRLQSDLLALVEAAVDQRLDQMAVRWNPRPCLAVVMAADGYPGTPRTGDTIDGLEVRHSLEVKVFHSATREVDGRMVTAGGRVLTVCALGDTVTQAQRTAYEAVDSLAWAGEHHRRDIGWRAAAREPRPLIA